MSHIAAWTRDIFIIILSITFVEVMLPEGTMKKYIKFIFSIIIMAVILSPIGEFLE